MSAAKAKRKQPLWVPDVSGDEIIRVKGGMKSLLLLLLQSYFDKNDYFYDAMEVFCEDVNRALKEMDRTDGEDVVVVQECLIEKMEKLLENLRLRGI